MRFQQGIGANLEPRHRGVVHYAGLTKEKAVHALILGSGFIRHHPCQGLNEALRSQFI
jgi:hypothetical protein